MSERTWAYRARASGLIAEGEYAAAGERLTLAGYETLGDEGLDPGIPGFSARGFELLYRAALAFRVAGEDARAANRSRQGIAIVEDYRDHVYRHDMSRAIATEFVGDFRVVAGRDGYGEAYERAADLYRTGECDSVLGWWSEPISECANGTFYRTLKRTGGDRKDVSLTRGRPDDREWLAARPEIKREQLPSLVGRLVDGGEMVVDPDPRDDVRCPECAARYRGLCPQNCIECGSDLPAGDDP